MPTYKLTYVLKFELKAKNEEEAINLADEMLFTGHNLKWKIKKIGED